MAAGETPEKIDDLKKLRYAVDRVQETYGRDVPLILELRGHERKVMFGVGAGLGFFQVSAPGGSSPYHAALGDADAGGELDFFYLGRDRHTIPTRYVLPQERVIEILETFFETAELDPGVEWETA